MADVDEALSSSLSLSLPDSDNVEAWKEVHAVLLEAVRREQEAVQMLQVQRRYWLEELVAELTAALPPLTEFVIPGGTRASALAHVCRTTCRRAERTLWDVEDAVDASVYANRLSDVFFQMARTAWLDT